MVSGKSKRSYSIDEKNRLFRELMSQKGLLKKNIYYSEDHVKDSSNLSYEQRGIWLESQINVSNNAYNISFGVEINGVLDTTLFKCSLNNIIKKHEILRASFYIEEGLPKYLIRNHKDIIINEYNVAHMASLEQQEFVSKLIDSATNIKFNIEEDNLLQATLIKLADNKYYAVFTVHHLVFDGWSIGIFTSELIHNYKMYSNYDESFSSPVLAQYSDYAKMQGCDLDEAKLVKSSEFWVEKLKKAPQLISFPYDFKRPIKRTFTGDTKLYLFSDDLVDALKKFGNENNTTLFVVLFSAFSILMAKYTQESDIVIGCPVLGRNDVKFMNTIGNFVNTIALRSHVDHDITYKEFLTNTKVNIYSSLEHSEMPFDELVRMINVKRDPSYSPIFQVMFEYQKSVLSNVSIPEIDVVPLVIPNRWSQYDFSMAFVEDFNGLQCSIEYNTSLLTQKSMDSFVLNFKYLLSEILHKTNRKVSELQIVNPGDKSTMLKSWNQEISRVSEFQNVYELFQKQVKNTPNEIAVYYRESIITYQELSQEVDKIASYVHTLKLSELRTVGICMESSVDYIVTMLGVLKAGRTYVPLNIEMPSKRINEIVDDAKIKIILTQWRHRSIFSENNIDSNICYVDDLLRHINDYNDKNEKAESFSNENACIIFTSGTTGRSKGTLLKHSGLINLILSFNETYKPSPMDRLLPLTSLTSSSFLGEYLPTLCSGSSLVLIDKETFLDFEKLKEFILSNKITIISTIPSVIAKLNASFDESSCLRLLLCGGEELTYGMIDNLIDHIDIVNGYGLTECTVCSTSDYVPKNNSNQKISIGKPIRNTQVYILDEYLNLLPIGGVGEIYISGVGVSSGYINDANKKSMRFIENPFLKNEIMFRTGDLGKWMANGCIEYNGRVDRQIKVRGFRVELGEIEAILCLHGDIENARVVASKSNNITEIKAYIVISDSINVTVTELKKWLKEHLPGYMIPNSYNFVSEIPIGWNGKSQIEHIKYDSKADVDNYNSGELPKTEIELKILHVWEQLLDVQNINIHDNFFDVGGHSLMLTQMKSRLYDEFDVNLMIIDFFKYPTIHDLANYIKNESHTVDTSIKINEQLNKQRKMLSLRKRNISKMRGK